MAKYWGNPPFFTQILFFQNDSEWLEMDFKHNFSQCNILTRETPRQSFKIRQSYQIRQFYQIPESYQILIPKQILESYQISKTYQIF